MPISKNKNRIWLGSGRFYLLTPVNGYLSSLAISASTPASDTDTYISRRYKFAFDYPSDSKLKRYGDGYFDILRDGEILLRGCVEDDVFRIFIREARPTGDIFKSFARERLKAVCAADGPDGSAYCDEIAGEQEFISENGLRVLEFNLTITRESYSHHTKRKSTIGPVYAVDISRHGRPIALMLSPPCGVPVSSATKQIMRWMVDTIRVVE